LARAIIDATDVFRETPQKIICFLTRNWRPICRFPSRFGGLSRDACQCRRPCEW